MNKSEIITKSEEETFLLAKKIGQELKGKEVILLIGELGAGKTIFVKGIASGAGVEDITEVCSPSYTILNVYEGKFPIYHFDLY
ncbi:tRNA (adenosine(37)-N6)-threonylcarbamoyltransferase complex ATPase subunit type 1 TsaE, partial [Candidatus Aminicenantes bacterium AH-873-B07]|nr:tRNA (adenosine(37)-N6)-threonylcarbamoyltransferase complex ATPase subunit type 1 TsaE [Candidatus Aminicenantes bacterium AH-873-B07]